MKCRSGHDTWISIFTFGLFGGEACDAAMLRSKEYGSLEAYQKVSYVPSLLEQAMQEHAEHERVVVVLGSGVWEFGRLFNCVPRSVGQFLTAVQPQGRWSLDLHNRLVRPVQSVLRRSNARNLRLLWHSAPVACGPAGVEEDAAASAFQER